MEYVQKVRIDRAKELLTYSELPISAVAAAVGIPRSPYFVTLFKKKTGSTPASYREWVREQEGKERMDIEAKP
jgi:AraC family transcriptional regulator, regulatory protein of adaptative response / methylphosphotriester-DNA alkyltransferase methyltransferase